MSNAFSGQILVEKLSKLNNSQQSIETLSQWCISHRQKAKQVVETWDKVFKSSQREQRVAFLYLANDILQNSRRKGSDFVNEFWKFLPAALRDVFQNGDDNGRKAATRLVDIWDERKVFGSRGRSLKDEMLGKDPPLLENKGRNSNPIKIVKKDAHSIRLKLAVGGMPEKILTAFELVHDEHFKEDAALNKCKDVVFHLGKLENDVENASAHGNQQVSAWRNELQEQENVLRQCLEQLQSVDSSRTTLISQLKEALHDQESKLELIRTQYQATQVQIQQASNMRQRLDSLLCQGPTAQSTATSQPAERGQVEPSTPPTTSATPQTPLGQPTTSFAAMRTATEDENKKAAAAAVVAKLAAMTSSAQMLTSVLSSLAAEEAASMSGGLQSNSITPNLPIFSPEKRPRLEKPMPVSEMGNSIYFNRGQQQALGNILPTASEASTTSIQSLSEVSQPQVQFPPPPPPPSVPPPPMHPYMQANNAMMGAMSYGYMASSLPPPPPLPTHSVMGLSGPGTQQQQPLQPPQQQQSQPQLQPAAGGYYQPPGLGFYGQNQQPAPPLPRQ